MANQYLTRQEITYAKLEVLENNCVVVPNMYRDLDQEFGKKGGKIGDTIFVRKPPRAIARDGQAYSPQAMIDTEVPVTINQQSGIDFEFSTSEKFLSLDDFQDRYLDPYMTALSNLLDFRALNTMMIAFKSLGERSIPALANASASDGSSGELDLICPRSVNPCLVG